MIGKSQRFIGPRVADPQHSSQVFNNYPMSIKDAVDLLFAARERIDFYWNFYVVVVIAVIGWILTLT